MAEKAAEARDTAVAELARLKTQAEKEQAAFEAEWRELGRMIENDRKMRDMLKAKRLSKLAAAANSAPLLKPTSAPSGDDKARGGGISQPLCARTLAPRALSAATSPPH